MNQHHSTKPYPEETRALAFQVWLFKASQSPARTAKLLATDEYGSITLTDETIRYWRDTERWTEKAQDAVRSIAGGLHMQTVVDQIAGVPEAISFLRQVVNGEIPNTDTKTRVTAALGLLDRSGLSPLGGKMARPSLTGPAQLPDLASMSASEAQALERQLVESSWSTE